MTWQSSPYLLLLFCTSLLAVICGVYAVATTRHGRKDYHTAFIALCVAAAIYSTAYAVQVASPDLATKRLAYNVLHLGVGIVPTAWLAFALCYTGRSRWVTRRSVAAMAAIPTALVLLLPSNPGSVVLLDVGLEVHDGLVLLDTDSGPLYQLFLAYNFVVVPLGAALLVVDALGSTRNVRLQSVLVSTGALIPLVVNVLHVLEIPPIGTVPINLTPVSVSVAGVLIAVAMFRHRLLELDPVARSAVFDHVREGVVVLNDHDEIVDHNPAAERLLGGEIALGTPIRAVVSAYDQFVDGDDTAVSTTLGTAGEERIVELRRSRLPGEADTDGWIVLLYDVTTRQRQRERLERQNDRLDSFTKIVSHDLRNPLAIIDGHAGLARETGDESHFETIDRTVDRMERFLEELLTLSQAGKTVADPEPVSLSTVAEAAHREADLPALSLTIAGDRVVRADRRRLTQLFDNLLRNAVTHAAEGDGVAVTVGPLADGFYIEDDGIGIPSELRETVFDYGETTHREGTGFGLGIVHDIVEAHGWAIEVTDGATGGARFEITGVGVVDDQLAEGR